MKCPNCGMDIVIATHLCPHCGFTEGLRGLLTDLSQRMPVRLQSFSTGQTDQFTLTLSSYMLDPVV